MCLGLFAGACGGETTLAAPAVTSSLQHVVLIKLKDPGQTDRLISECKRLLADIPGVTGLDVGRPIDLGREDVTDDYDVGLVVSFENQDDYRGYLIHPQHRELAAWRDRWEWYRIFDILDAP